MKCPDCNQEIKDKAFKLHRILKHMAQTAGATVVTTPEPKPVFDHEVAPASGEAGAHDSVVTDTHTEPVSRPAPVAVGLKAATTAAVGPTAAPPTVGTYEYREWWSKLNQEQQEAELIRRGLPPKDMGVQPQEMPQVSSQNGSEVFYPVIDPYFVVPEFIADALSDTDAISRKKPTNLLVTGQPGGGKTSLALQYAARGKRPAVVADFGILQEPQQLFQTTRLVENENGLQVTQTQESAFIKGIETPNCVVIMDEMTRVENERCLNPLMPILDGRRSTWIDELHRRIHVADGVVFIATINEGSMFAGITSLDAALRDRFREIFMDYLPAEQESRVIQSKTGVSKLIGNSLAEFAYAVRHTPAISRKVSTRQLLHAAEAYAVGGVLWRAVFTAIGNYNDLAWRQEVLEIFSLNIKDPTEYQKWVNKPRMDKYVEYK